MCLILCFEALPLICRLILVMSKRTWISRFRPVVCYTFSGALNPQTSILSQLPSSVCFAVFNRLSMIFQAPSCGSQNSQRLAKKLVTLSFDVYLSEFRILLLFSQTKTSNLKSSPGYGMCCDVTVTPGDCPKGSELPRPTHLPSGDHPSQRTELYADFDAALRMVLDICPVKWDSDYSLSWAGMS